MYRLFFNSYLVSDLCKQKGRKEAANRCPLVRCFFSLKILKFTTSEISVCLFNFFFSIHNKRTSGYNRFV